MVFLYGYAILSSRAIDAQNRHIRALLESRAAAAPTRSEPKGGAGGVPESGELRPPERDAA